MPDPIVCAAQGIGGLTAYDGMVVLTSLLLVFAMLIALSLIVTAEGKLFDTLNARKKAKAQAALRQPPAAVPAPAVPAVPAAPAPAPAVQGGIAPEIVAAIAAAVYAAEGQSTAIHAIRRLPAGAPRRRGAWGDAGVAENVTPF